MAYYSTVMIAVTKKGYEKIKKDQEKFSDYELLKLFNVSSFGRDNSFILMETEETIKYYREYEYIQQLEKTLSKLKDGYVFARIGEENLDVEFRNNAKTKELLEPFDFVKELSDNLNKELKKEEEDEFE